MTLSSSSVVYSVPCIYCIVCNIFFLLREMSENVIPLHSEMTYFESVRVGSIQIFKYSREYFFASPNLFSCSEARIM